MHRASDSHQQHARLGPLGAAWLGSAALLMFAVSLWMGSNDLRSDAVASDGPLNAGSWAFAFAWLALAAALAVAAGLAGAGLARARLANALRDARLERQSLACLLDVWQWQTDDKHSLVRLLPPQAAPAAAWSNACDPLRPIWDRFEVGAPNAGTLNERLSAQALIWDLRVEQRAPGTPLTQWLLRGTPYFDSTGRFAGYVGTAREAQAQSFQVMQPGATAPDPDLADHESFSYMVSHDLRAPIRVVDGFARIVKEDYGRLLDKIGNDHLDRVLGAASRMNAMIDALLGLSQLSAQPLSREAVNLSHMAGHVVDELRRNMPQRTVDVHVESGMLAHGDPTLLRVVLENLLGNAWKYTAKASHPQIWVQRTEHDGRKAYAVRDNGAGFDMRFADRLFGAFQRLHSASDFEGTGIGLASVRRIIRRHGGDIWAASEVNRGASFYFTLQRD